MLLAHSMLLLLPLPVRGAGGGGQVVCRTVCVGVWVGGGTRGGWRWGVKVYLLLQLEEGLFTASRHLAFNIYGFSLYALSLRTVVRPTQLCSSTCVRNRVPTLL